MDDPLRYQKDRATVLSIIKYILYILIAAAVLYFSSKVIVIIVPFLIGFVLAKASRLITNGLMGSGGKRAAQKHASQNQVAEKEIPVREPRIRGKFLQFFFPVKTTKKLSTRTKVSVAVYVILLVLVLAVLVLTGFLLVVQANKVINFFPKWISQTDFVSRISQYISTLSVENGGFLSADMIGSITAYVAKMQATAVDKLPDVVSSVFGKLISIVGNIPMILFYIIVIIMSGFYFLIDSRLVFEFLSRNIKSRSFRHKSILLVDRLSTTLFRVLGGYLLLLIITFFESLVIFLVAGVDYAVLLALITAVLDFIPVLGVSATMVPVMIYLGVQGNYVAVLILLVGMGIITVVRRFIEPPVLGNAMHMHPMATLFAMIFGVAVWGAIGFLMGPVVLLVFIEAAKGFSLDQKLRTSVGKILNKFSED